MLGFEREGEMMGNDENAVVVICTAPPGLYAVITSTAMESDSDIMHTVQVVTAFKYTYFDGGARKIFSEPLVYCESKSSNALVDGSLKIEFVGSHEDCVMRIKELVSLHYAEKNVKED